ncbi:hypothetical protein NW759_000067 [Fusarium solani]|nr:hypothetical protein NW759_000067 [Fusarium solani]
MVISLMQPQPNTTPCLPKCSSFSKTPLHHRKPPVPFSMTNRTGRRALFALYPNADRGIKFCDVSIATLMAFGAAPVCNAASPQPRLQVSTLADVHQVESSAAIKDILNSPSCNTHTTTYTQSFKVVQMKCHALQASIADCASTKC